MSLASATSRMAPYTGNGSTATYAYTFKIFSDSDLLVTKRLISTGAETELVLDADYTVTGAGTSSGGNVVLSAGNLSSSYELHIRRKRPLTQSTSIRNESSFNAGTHEDTFDKLTMIDQQQQDEIDRSMKLPETIDPADFDPTLPAILTPGYTLIVSDDGLGIALGPSEAQLEQAVIDAAATAVNAAAAAASAASASASATAASASATAAAASASAASASATAAAASAAVAAAAVGWAVTGSRSSPQDITAGAGVTALGGITPREHQFVQGSGGAVTVTANPQISAGGTVSQQLKLVGRSDVNTLTLQDGTGLSLKGTWVGGADSVLELFWDGSVWVEDGRA
jgi:hypothetical protein